MNLKLLFGVLASSIVPLITYIVSTIIANVQLIDDDWVGILILSLYFISCYLTFILFIGFLVVVILAALNIFKNYHLLFTLACLDGAVMVTTGASLYVSITVGYRNGAGFGMFVGVAVLLLIKIFHILPLTFELLTKGISLWNTRNEEYMLRKYLPFAIYAALVIGFITSLVYTGAALAVTIKWYAEPGGSHSGYYYSPVNHFQYSLPLFIFLQMMVAMVVFVQFKWKWGVRTFAVLSSFLLVILGYALNMMALELHAHTDSGNGNDFNKILHKGNISMTVAAIFMILITIFVNIAWPVLYNLRNPTGNEETNIALPVLPNPTANEDAEPLLN